MGQYSTDIQLAAARPKLGSTVGYPFYIISTSVNASAILYADQSPISLTVSLDTYTEQFATLLAYAPSSPSETQTTEKR